MCLSFLIPHKNNCILSFLYLQRLQIFGWCLSIFCSASVIYGLYHVNLSSTLLNMYNAFGRTSFSLGVAWVIFCCLTGNAGKVKWNLMRFMQSKNVNIKQYFYFSFIIVFVYYTELICDRFQFGRISGHSIFQFIFIFEEVWHQFRFVI